LSLVSPSLPTPTLSTPTTVGCILLCLLQQWAASAPFTPLHTAIVTKALSAGSLHTSVWLGPSI
jgi:hypothetical protein